MGSFCPRRRLGTYFVALSVELIDSLCVAARLPTVLVWLYRTTVAHARSKEDVLRRLDEIERQVNYLAREELLVIQSRHPNRHRSVSGRSGLATLRATLSLCLLSLAGCGGLFLRESGELTESFWFYAAYLLSAACSLLRETLALARYRYEKSPPGTPPVFARH